MSLFSLNSTNPDSTLSHYHEVERAVNLSVLTYMYEELNGLSVVPMYCAAAVVIIIIVVVVVVAAAAAAALVVVVEAAAAKAAAVVYFQT